MKPLGYLYKTVANKPGWIKSSAVHDIYSLSNCVSKNFSDYINYWKHNGYWLFDSPEMMEEIAKREVIDISNCTLFYYEAYEFEYDADSEEWQEYEPEPTLTTNIKLPLAKELQGFDVTSFLLHTSPECSPLSCNSLAEHMTVNEHCLLPSLEAAKDNLESGEFDHSEPGPYRIIAVYKVETA
jgi:hypothetical protein